MWAKIPFRRYVRTICWCRNSFPSAQSEDLMRALERVHWSWAENDEETGNQRQNRIPLLWHTLQNVREETRVQLWTDGDVTGSETEPNLRVPPTDTNPKETFQKWTLHKDTTTTRKRALAFQWVYSVKFLSINRKNSLHVATNLENATCMRAIKTKRQENHIGASEFTTDASSTIIKNK